MGRKTRSRSLELAYKVRENQTLAPYIKANILVGIVNELIRDAEGEERKAYKDRNAVVSVLTKLFPAYLCEDGVGYAVTVELPSGQVGWHILDEDLHMFIHLKIKQNNFDGHSNEEKEQRLLSLPVNAKESQY